jgi:O-succinylbenzoate synthase
MTIRRIELIRARINLVSPFRTSFGTQTDRELLFVRVIDDLVEGWGECVAMSEPGYSAEYVDGCARVIERFLVPLIGPNTTAEQFVESARSVRGNFMAKAAVEAALLDRQLRVAGISLAHYLGATNERVASGVSVGIQPTIDDLLRVVGGYLDDGYLRIKLKIEPGADVEQVRAVRRAYGDDLLLQVDANAAYSVSDAEHLARLDEFHLLLIEQPLPEEDVVGHVDLARKVRTPICLDESITSYEVARGALDIGACSIINIKPGRVGGLIESKRIHDLCLDRGIPVWCGGMLETGVGRAANLALAALPGFTLPGDTSASNRYFVRDITEPFVLEDGHIRVPNEPGASRHPDPSVLNHMVTDRTTFTIQ